MDEFASGIVTDDAIGNRHQSHVLAAGLIFLVALCLGIWKYKQMATSDTDVAHSYVDLNLTAAMVVAIATYIATASGATPPTSSNTPMPACVQG